MGSSQKVFFRVVRCVEYLITFQPKSLIHIFIFETLPQTSFFSSMDTNYSRVIELIQTLSDYDKYKVLTKCFREYDHEAVSYELCVVCNKKDVDVRGDSYLGVLYCHACGDQICVECLKELSPNSFKHEKHMWKWLSCPCRTIPSLFDAVHHKLKYQK